MTRTRRDPFASAAATTGSIKDDLPSPMFSLNGLESASFYINRAERKVEGVPGVEGSGGSRKRCRGKGKLPGKRRSREHFGYLVAPKIKKGGEICSLHDRVTAVGRVDHCLSDIDLDGPYDNIVFNLDEQGEGEF